MNQEPIIQCFQGLDEGSGARKTRRVFGASNVCRGLVLHRVCTGSKDEAFPLSLTILLDVKQGQTCV